MAKKKLRRQHYIRQLCTAVGIGAMRIIDEDEGWPGTVELQTDSGTRHLAIYIALVNRLYKTRRPEDYRILPPIGKPIKGQEGFHTLALGLWGDPLIVVACDPERWKAESRSSQMVKLSKLKEAQSEGWASYRNTDGDVFHAFRPFLFPTYVEAVVRKVNLTTLTLATPTLPTIVAGTWAASTNTSPNQERARQACTRAVRDVAFRRDVAAAYDGRCAMCGLNFGLVVAAHIYPVAASGSVDEVVNGLCLCPNHHQAFDGHRIWVDPDTKTIKVHPDLQSGASPGDKAITSTLFPVLRLPTDSKDHPSPKWFRQRYEHSDFVGHYGWATSTPS